MTIRTRVLVTEAALPPGAQEPLAIGRRARVHKVPTDPVLLRNIVHVVALKLEELVLKLQCIDAFPNFIVVPLALNVIFGDDHITLDHVNVGHILTNLREVFP